jgi:hypothetical protein
MKTFLLLIMGLTLLSACSNDSNKIDTLQYKLDVANKQITELQSQLEAEKEKSKVAELLPVKEATELEPKHKPQPEPEDLTGNQWTYINHEDEMSGGITHKAYVTSSNTVSFGFPYEGAQYGRLILRTDPKYGKDIIFNIEKGQILCNSYEHCQILVRFDEEKPIKFSAIGPSDSSSEVIFISNYSKFVGKMLKAKVVRISPNIYQEGSPVFEFDISGFNEKNYKENK